MLEYQDYIVWNPANVKSFPRKKTGLIPKQKMEPEPVTMGKPSIYVNYPFSTEM